MIPVNGAFVTLVAVKLGIFPIPFAPNPIDIFEFVHENVPPVGVLTKLEAAIVTLLQTAMFADTATVGVGNTVIVKLEAVPTHPFAVGVTVIVAKIGTVELFVAVNPPILPVPLKPKPIDVLELVHTKVPPIGVLIKFMADTVLLLHATILAGTVTVGVG